MKAIEIIDKVSIWDIRRKIEFLECFLREMTIMNRAIWDDNDYDDSEKVNCLKWSNELAHRIWNIKFELERGNDENSLNNLLDNIISYRKIEPKLGGHFGATLKSTYENATKTNTT